MTQIQKTGTDEIAELLGKCWITHDGMWFAHTLSAHGIDEANRLNRAAIKSMVPIEIKRFMTRFRVRREDLDNFAAFASFFSRVQPLLIPAFMNLSIRFTAPGTMGWRFNGKGCFAASGIARTGMLSSYLCGPLFRIQCWLDHLDISYEMIPQIRTCIMADMDSCSGEFRLLFSKRGGVSPIQDDLA